MPEDTKNPSAAPPMPLYPSPDRSTFVFPDIKSLTIVVIEFCDRCRWLPRASWMQMEIILTFPPPVIGSVCLVPRNSDDTAGRFRVWLEGNSHDPARLIWDRKVEGGFPELTILKQRIRDLVQPERSLGHSDVNPRVSVPDRAPDSTS